MLEKDKIRFYKKLLVFLFFLIVAAIFWFLNILNRDYTTDLQYPVRYINLPNEKVLVNNLPSNLSLHVTGHGYTLLKHIVSKKPLPIIFDVNSFVLNLLDDSVNQKFYVLSRVASSKISNQLSGELEILEIFPDSIIFVFSDVVKKKLPVKPVLDLEFEKQFMIKGVITSTPDSVEVQGPNSVIDTMQYAYTKRTRIQKVNESITKSVFFEEYDQVSYSKKRVILNIPVEQFTEAGLKIPITAVNVPDKYSLKLFPGEINVSYMVALSDYDNIIPQHFMAVADYKLLEKGKPQKLTIQLSRVPDNIVILRYYPEAVDYIIEK